VEGPTEDPEVLEARAREQRNFIATLLLSQGVPMLLHGDELSRTQDGNNNTYAQDSEISWVHWDDADKPLIEFTAAVAKLRADHPTFRRKRFFTGNTVRTGDGERLNDIVWLGLDGEPMGDDAWGEGAKAIGMYLNGHGIAGKDARGGTITDDHFLLYFNADGPADVTLPPDEYAGAWDVVIDTGGSADTSKPLFAGSTFHLETHSLVVLREHAEAEAEPDHSVAASLASLVEATTVESTPAADQRHQHDQD
jgi:glycogen operon protein